MSVESAGVACSCQLPDGTHAIGQLPSGATRAPGTQGALDVVGDVAGGAGPCPVGSARHVYTSGSAVTAMATVPVRLELSVNEHA